jgi:hypothetical protein
MVFSVLLFINIHFYFILHIWVKICIWSTSEYQTSPIFRPWECVLILNGQYLRHVLTTTLVHSCKLVQTIWIPDILSSFWMGKTRWLLKMDQTIWIPDICPVCEWLKQFVYQKWMGHFKSRNHLMCVLYLYVRYSNRYVPHLIFEVFNC